MTAPETAGQAAYEAPAADVLASLPRQWDAEADATAHWGDDPNERSAYANALRDCASELRKTLAAIAAAAPAPAPPPLPPKWADDGLALAAFAAWHGVTDDLAGAWNAQDGRSRVKWRASADAVRAIAAAAPAGQADWWVCDGPLPPHGTGKKIIGPFATQELALNVRYYVEKAENRDDLWVDDEAIAAAAPAPAAAPDKLTLHIAHDEFRQWMAGEGYDWADDSYQAEAFAAGFTRSDALWKAYGRQPQAAPELAAAMAESRRYREGIARFANKLEAEAAKDESARERQGDGVARLLLQRTADLQRLIAADIRKLA